VTGSAPAQLLDWDSQFFGWRIARVSGSRLTEETVADVLAWCADNAVDCLYLLADPSCPLTPRVASRHAFNLVDVRVTLSRGTPAPAVGTEAARSLLRVRPSQESDIPALCELAQSSFRDSRFYFDGHFDHARCDLLFRTWIERSCRGWAETVLVGVVDGRLAGFVTCHLNDVSTGRIGLVGVAPEHRGSGVGRHLVARATAWFESRGCPRIEVVTQGRNVAAQRLYQVCGFRTQALELWFHWWSARHTAPAQTGSSGCQDRSGSTRDEPGNSSCTLLQGPGT
jgi:dTDP-4-amino-4,6-dideoxy-D-galactose acyltransferase